MHVRLGCKYDIVYMNVLLEMTTPAAATKRTNFLSEVGMEIGKIRLDAFLQFFITESCICTM